MKNKITNEKIGEFIIDCVHPSCPKCKSKQVLTKKMSMTRWCRRCGEEWSVKK